MKKIIIYIILAFNGLHSYSQDFRFSFMANPQLSWFSGKDDDYESNGIFLGMNAGLEADFFFSENYAFSTGLTINNYKGGIIYDDSLIFKLSDDDKTLPPGTRMSHNLQYIGIPLGLKFKTVEIGYSTYWLNTGFTPMILIKSKISDESGTFDKENFKDGTGLFNMNYFIEAGLEYSLGGNTALIGGLGYYTGFMDVTERSSDKINTNAFALIMGILF